MMRYALPVVFAGFCMAALLGLLDAARGAGVSGPAAPELVARAR